MSLPSERSTDEASEPTFILASRLQIIGNPKKKHGVQQIILLPTTAKACVLCNGVVTFYSLPELSPAFENTKVNSQWIGGLDLNKNEEEQTAEKPVIMIALSNRIVLVQLGETAHRIRSIEFPGCLAGARRGTIACVADGNAYSLLEVEHQQKIPLFPISSMDTVLESGNVEDISQVSSTLKRSSSASHGSPNNGTKSEHYRSSSLNTSSGQVNDRLHPSLLTDRSTNSAPLASENSTPRRSVSRERGDTNRSADARPTPNDLADARQKPLPPAPKPQIAHLKPHIVAPSPSEFLLVTGTQADEPGVGIFVNTDGDVVRGTMEFQQYPEAIILDRPDDANLVSGMAGSPAGFILAIIDLKDQGLTGKHIEIQRWDVDPGEYGRHRTLVQIPSVDGHETAHVGMNYTVGSSKIAFQDVGETLRKVKLRTPPIAGTYTPTEENDPRTNATIEQVRKEKELFESQELTDSESGKRPNSLQTMELERTREEAAFASRFGNMESHLVLWSGNCVWRIVRNPLPLQLDKLLQSAQKGTGGEIVPVDRDAIIDLLDSIKSTEPTTEAEFFGLEYIKQKAALILFADLLLMESKDRTQSTMLAAEGALAESNLDPRLILFMIPLLAEEAIQAKQGIWVHRGLAREAEFYLDHLRESKVSSVVPDDALMDMIKRHLASWQKKRGYGSVTDETNVFDSIDAALLHLVLEQEARAKRTNIPAVAGGHAELYKLLDSWKGHIDRAVSLLERYHRLYALSRLYQRQKLFGKVLRTWQRIANGEKEHDPEVTIPLVESQVKKYLCQVRDTQLIEEYGSWLASRNSNLGIQVFSDDNAKVKFEPDKVVQLLKKRAPNAVQDYLEHLVFTKKVRGPN